MADSSGVEKRTTKHLIGKSTRGGLRENVCPPPMLWSLVPSEGPI